MTDHFDKPNFLVYMSYLVLFGISINTVYLVLPNESLRWYLIGMIVIAVMTGVVVSSRFYGTIGLVLDVAGLGVFIYYAYKIFYDRGAFGTYMGEMLSMMLVLRSFKLFRHQDFFLPLIISLTLIVFSSIPSFSGEFVYSLLTFMLFLGISLFLSNIDEFSTIPRKKKKHSVFRYTYDFLEELSPIPVSKQKPSQLSRYILPAFKAGIPAVLIAFLVSSLVYFTVDHTYQPGVDAPILGAFGSAGLEYNNTNSTDLLTGTIRRGTAQYYTGFDDEFNIASGRLVENSTSTRIVMEVESNLPSYWRGKGFDTYTGRGWVQSEETSSTTWKFESPTAQRTQYRGDIRRSDLIDAGITADPDIYKEEIRQVYHLKSDLPGIVFTAWQPVEVKMNIPAVVIDDTFTIYSPDASDAMVSGQVYQVTSHKHFAQGSYLNTYDYKPSDLSEDDPEFYERYTQLPERGDADKEYMQLDFTRIRAKAYEITAGAKTVYEKVAAIERFLQTRFRYSLNPPSAVPPELGAVDYFLFDWEPRRGHCEYFSSSMAVLLRSIGIPARVVTGYATGNYNLFRNVYVVQERHAHAWVEVFWPDIGWVEYDPTPQLWYQGIGEKAAGGWVSFHNAIEELYVYNPRNFIDNKVKPVFWQGVYSVAYFMNHWDLDYYEYVEPYLPGAEKIPVALGWVVIGSLALYLTANSHKRRTSMDFFTSDALRISGGNLRKIKRGLVRKGISSDMLATEMDCAIAARNFSPDWSAAVWNLVALYQKVKYSGHEHSRQDLLSLRRTSRTASRIPQK